jgi:hypothetical protein
VAHRPSSSAQPPHSMSPRRPSHGDGGAQGHNRPKSPNRRGTAVLRREGQQPGREFHGDASPLTSIQLRKGSKGEKREERPRCSRWGDGVVVAGLSMARRWCSGVMAFRRGRRSPVAQGFTPSMCSAAPVRAPAALGPRLLLLLVRRGGDALPPLARRRRAGVAASPLGPAWRRRLAPHPLTAPSLNLGGRENPNGVGGGGQQAIRLSPCF